MCYDNPPFSSPIMYVIIASLDAFDIFIFPKFKIYTQNYTQFLRYANIFQEILFYPFFINTLLSERFDNI